MGKGVDTPKSINLLAYSKDRFALVGRIYLYTKLLKVLGILKDFTFNFNPSTSKDFIMLRCPIVTDSPEVSNSWISAINWDSKCLYFG